MHCIIKSHPRFVEWVAIYFVDDINYLPTLMTDFNISSVKVYVYGSIKNYYILLVYICVKVTKYFTDVL